MSQVRPLPKHAVDDAEIAQLTDLYQQQLAELNACHSLLLSDQERLASMIAPFMSPSGQVLPDIASSIDSKILIFKDGLDLRLQEFQEDCKRVHATERRLQRKIEQAAADYESNFMASSGLADARILKRLKEQQRVIQIQQQELDQLRFEKDLLEGENNRLKVLCVKSPDDYSFRSPVIVGCNGNGAYISTPSLHVLSEANQKPVLGTQRVLHAKDQQPSSAQPISSLSNISLATAQPTSSAVIVPNPPNAGSSSWFDGWLGGRKQADDSLVNRIASQFL